MKYELSYDAERDVIAGRVSGALDPAEVRQMAAEFARLARTHGCLRLLNDLGEAGTSYSALYVYTMPKMVHEHGGMTSCWRALVVPGDSEVLSFLESVAQTIGETVRVFTDRESAMEWLSRGSQSAPASGEDEG
ncbi:MAG: STAS/SEC14 domain-containing protein [Desulfohalobiaceae bacterium]